MSEFGVGEKFEYNGGDKGRRPLEGFIHKLSVLGGKDQKDEAQAEAAPAQPSAQPVAPQVETPKTDLKQ